MHIDGRKFPGLAIQGDSLSIIQDVVSEAVKSDDSEQIGFALRELADTVGGMVAAYENMMSNAGLPLPYFRAE